jgi:hypothetical protein
MVARAASDRLGLPITEVELAVDSESKAGATALYERAGMRSVPAWEEWTKAIPAGD